MATGPLTVIRQRLRQYADRGVFRGLSEPSPGCFRFTWLINQQMELSVDTTGHSLRFKRLLAGVPPTSAMYADLKGFIRQRHDGDLPAHRRIDWKRAEATCVNRAGFVSVSVEVKNNQYAYGVKRILNLVHEVFVHLRQAYPEYLAERFNVPEE